jgi:hypothetical protein
VQGLPSCNGWTFWHFFREERCQPIDALRSLLEGEPAPGGGIDSCERRPAFAAASGWPRGWLGEMKPFTKKLFSSLGEIGKCGPRSGKPQPMTVASDTFVAIKNQS